MVYLNGNSKAEFQHSDFSGSGYYALWVPAGGNIDGFEDNTIVENVRALIVHPNRAAAVTGSTRIASNPENRIRVTFGNTDAVTTAQAWAHPATPFYVADRTFVQAALQIMPGTTVEFAQDASLVVNNGGPLSVGGTTGTVTMKGGEDLAGYWKGVEYGTVSAQNVMSRVDISNAGSAAWFGGANSTGSVNITGSGSVALSDVRFAKSGGYAAIIASGGAISCSNVDHGGFRYINRAANAAVSLCP